MGVLSDFSAPTRDGNRTCEFEACVPDQLAGRKFTLDGPVAADVADAARTLGDEPSDVIATEVLGNIDVMVYGLQSIQEGDAITIDLLLEIHRRIARQFTTR